MLTVIYCNCECGETEYWNIYRICAFDKSFKTTEKHVLKAFSFKFNHILLNFQHKIEDELKKSNDEFKVLIKIESTTPQKISTFSMTCYSFKSYFLYFQVIL
jgi:hypothetical protein